MLIRNLGTLQAKIVADTKQLEKDLKKGEKDLKGFSASASKWLKPIGVAMAGVGVAITGALTAMVFSAGKAGDAFDKMSLRTGESVEALSALKFAAEISGSTMGDVEIGLRRLAANMFDFSEGIGEARRSFETLGIEVIGTDGLLRSSVDVMLDVADGLKSIESESEKTAIAQELFGRSGQKLLPLLKSGSEGMTALTDRARDLGLVMSTEAASASAEFQDRLTELTGTVKMASFNLAQVLLPTVTNAVEKITDIVGVFNTLDDTTKSIIAWTAAIGGVGFGLVGALALLGAQLPNVIAGFTTLSSITLGPIGLSIAAVAVSIGLAAAAFREFKKASKDIFLEDEFARQQSNIEGIERSILRHKKTLETLEKVYQDVKDGGVIPFLDQQFLLDAGIKNTGDGIEASFLPAIKLMEDRISRARQQLFEAKGGLGQFNQEAARIPAVIRQGDKALEKSGKTYKVYYEFLLSEFDNWVSITGEGFKANEQDQIEWLDSVLETVEKDSEAWRGLTNKRTQLLDQQITKAIAFEKEFTEVIIEENKKRERELRINTDDHNAEMRKKRDREALDELTTETETADKKINIQEGEFEVRKKIADDGIGFMGFLTQAQINAGNARGEALVREQENAEAVLKASQVSWGEFGNTVGRGMNAVGDAYLGVVDIWRTLTGDQRDFHDTWITDMVDWVNRIANLMNSVITIWKDASTIISKFAQVLGGDGGGGTSILGTAGQVGGTASGIGSLVGKIGGAGKAVGAGVAKGAGAVAGLPFGQIAGVAGPLAASAVVLGLVGNTILSSFRGEEFINTTGRGQSRGSRRTPESRRALQLAFQETIRNAPEFTPTETNARFRNIGGRFLPSEGGGSFREVSAAVSQSNAFLGEIASNTRAMAQSTTQRNPISRSELAEALAELLLPRLRSGEYI